MAALWCVKPVRFCLTCCPPNRPNPAAQPVMEVMELTADILDMAGDSQSRAGTGGMRTKLQAAQKAAAAGIDTFLFNGRNRDVLRALAQGQLYGTHLISGQTRIAARKYWLRHIPVEPGSIWIDLGAAHALRAKGASLLPGGVTRVEGEFRRGDMVAVHLGGGEDAETTCIARGISQYSAADIRRIAGRHSRQIETVLGYSYSDTVIHRDDLVVV